MFGWRQRRRQRVAARPFPPGWSGILEHHAGFYRLLTPADRRELQRHIQVFLDEKPFEGCGGLAITDEIRVTIAAHACLLLLHRPTDYYPQLSTILVYPHPFVVERLTPGPAGQVLEAEQVLAGESWRQGAVILAWDEVLHAAHDVHDGRNVALHEFAHQLDAEDGAADGAPLLPRRSRIVAWARVLGRDYAGLVRDTARGATTLLDPYGSTSPAEFFAVATEFFFEAPARLRQRHPELYEELKGYYAQDPAADWQPDPRRPLSTVSPGSPFRP